MEFLAVIVAGGSGSRAGPGGAKQWRDLAGKPVIRWSAEALLAAGATQLVVVIPNDARSLADKALAGLPRWKTAPGGATFVLMAYTDGPPPAFSESINLFIAPDVDGLLERLRKAGGRVTQAAADMPQHGVRVAFGRDAEGHLIEIVQPL